MRQRETESLAALGVCHASCRRSKNLGPFSGCKCRCGGLSHGSETLHQMRGRARAKAQAEMRQDLYRGELAVQARVFLAMQDDFLEHLQKRNGAAAPVKRRKAA